MRMRLTIRLTGDRTRDLMTAAAVRRELLTCVPVEIDPYYPLHGTHRDVKGQAYFEFATDYPERVLRFVEQYGDCYEVTEVTGEFGQECVKCGNVAGDVLPSVCPNCGFRDISPCPNCRRLNDRTKYIQLEGDLFLCPTCQTRVRLHYNDPLFLVDGEYNQPLVVVQGITAGHEI
jgi:predicted RNA-binding Zn-ribbon protein involved in translation (DUF1610 family)